jgi:hypothetical protein
LSSGASQTILVTSIAMIDRPRRCPNGTGEFINEPLQVAGAEPDVTSDPCAKQGREPATDRWKSRLCFSVECAQYLSDWAGVGIGTEIVDNTTKVVFTVKT